jgi:tetratricopeptide (TPR) repeat protein
MGQYILCGPAASQPWVDRDLGIRIMSMEEMAYYILHFVPLIDSGFVDTPLYDFLKSLGKADVAERIRRSVRVSMDLYQVLMILLRDSGYCSEKEIADFFSVYNDFHRKPPTEQQLDRADLLYGRGRYENAVRIYEKILEGLSGADKNSGLFPKVSQHMGACYMHLRCYDEAMECFRAAWNTGQDPGVQKQIFFAAMLAGKPLPQELENVDAMSFGRWQAEYLEAETRHLNSVRESLEERGVLPLSQDTENGMDSYLSELQDSYRRMRGMEVFGSAGDAGRHNG